MVVDPISVIREGSGPEVLLVHGGASPRTTWSALESLKPRWTLALVHRRGYPPSPGRCGSSCVSPGRQTSTRAHSQRRLPREFVVPTADACRERHDRRLTSCAMLASLRWWPPADTHRRWRRSATPSPPNCAPSG